jgi:hypothetical protein
MSEKKNQQWLMQGTRILLRPCLSKSASKHAKRFEALMRSTIALSLCNPVIAFAYTARLTKNKRKDHPSLQQTWFHISQT